MELSVPNSWGVQIDFLELVRFTHENLLFLRTSIARILKTGVGGVRGRSNNDSGVGVTDGIN